MKSLKRTLICFACASVMLFESAGITAAAEGYDSVVSESFNECVTNGDVPEYIVKNGKRIVVKDYGKNNKAAFIATLPRIQSLSFPASLTGEYFVCFDLAADNAFSAKIILEMGAVRRTVAEIDNGTLKTHNGKKAGSVGQSGARISMAFDQNANSYSLYSRNISGGSTSGVSDNYIAGFRLNTVTAVTLEFTSSVNAGVYLDNVNIGRGSYNGEAAFETVPCNPEALPEVSFEAPPVSDAVYINEPFDEDKSSIGHYYNKDNMLEKTVTKEDGGVCIFKRLGAEDAHLDIDDTTVTGEETSALVYQLDIKLANSDTSLLCTLKDRQDKYFDYALIKQNGVLVSGDYSCKVPVGKWFTLSLCYDLYQSTYTIYIDGKAAMPQQIYNGEYNHDRGYIWRMHAQGNGADDCFYLDNIKAYGGETPRSTDEPSGTVETEFEDKYIILRSEDSAREYMKDKVGYHTRSKVMYVNGRKSMAESVNINGSVYITPEFFYAAYPNRIRISGSDVYVDGNKLDSSVALCVTEGGKEYVPLRALCEKGLGRYVAYDNTTVHSGMIIIADSPITLPDGAGTIYSAHDPSKGAYMMHCSERQNLNDLLFFRRPEMSVIENDYNASKLSGVHPRIMLDAADFEQIKKNVKTDARMANWYGGLITEANKLLKQEPLVYELRDGVRLWFVSNDFVSRMMTLSLAYRLTGDKKYSDRGYTEMKAIADFKGWHPEHHIDVAALGIGYAIGYDWLYETYTKEQLEYLEKRAYDNFYTEYIKGFRGLSGYMAEGISFNNNHNAVMNGGSVIMANAFMDVFPEASRYIMAGSIRASENMLYNFAPSGNWYEGVSYGTMTLRFLAYLMATVDKIYGTEYTLDKSEGLDQAAQFCIYMQCPAGPYSFSDATSNGASRSVVLEPSMLWFASYYGDSSVQTTWFKIFHYAPTGDTLARSILWYRPEYADRKDTLDIDKLYPSINVEVMRNNWMPIGQTMVGVKGGRASVEHAHMDMGSFGFTSGDTRWIDDIGADDYDLLEFFHGESKQGKRWSYYRERAEAHSCVIVAPDAKGSEYDPNVTAKLTAVENKPKGAIATVDLTDSIGKDKVKSAMRGFNFTDDRQSLVVRDEINIKKKSDVYWLAYTNEEARVEGNSVILTSTKELGKTLKIDFICNQPFEVSVGAPEPLPETKSYVQSFDNKGYRIVFKTNAQGPLEITAKLTPGDVENPSDVSAYNMPIADWRVPDGSIKIKPYLDSLFAGDIELSTSSADQDIIVDGDEELPVITAVSENYDVSIKPAAAVGDTAAVTVTDRADSTNVSVYNVRYRTLAPTGYPGVNEITIKNVKVSDEPQPENCAANVLDRNLDTRWSADGAQSMTLDLGRKRAFDKVIMAFMDGNSRKYNIAISISDDDSEYKTVYDGASSGTTNDYEAFELGLQEARYIKIMGNGHDSGTWDSWTEVAVAISR